MEGISEGTIFDIQGFSVHDGPGCRTVVFFKGCSLQCAWCCNPESKQPWPEPLLNNSRCINDGLCVQICTLNALTMTNQGPVIDKTHCGSCTSHECINACHPGALRIAGSRITAEKLLQRVLRDRPYWGKGGGVTLSGGEPFVQAAFVQRFLEGCWEAYIHTAAETCGNVPWENIKPSLQYLEWLFFDLKNMDSARHKAMCGSGNERILENATRISESFGGRLVFRMPLIPGFNDSADNVSKTAEFVRQLGQKQINVLPLHHLGREKYNLLQNEYAAANLRVPATGEIEKVQDIFTQCGLECYSGSNTPF